MVQTSRRDEEVIRQVTAGMIKLKITFLLNLLNFFIKFAWLKLWKRAKYFHT